MRTGVRVAVIILASMALISCSVLGGSGKSRSSSGDVSTIGVNSFLWRAALETIEFMPLSSADPYGGVIITGWHSDSNAPNERFKATVYILDTRLRADAVKVSVFKQGLNQDRMWVDVNVNPDTELQIENAILTRARELKISTLG